MLVGFAGAFRRSELARMEISDLQFSADGVMVNLPTSKTDQEGAGRKVGLPFGANSDTCPVRLLRCWLTAAQISGGLIFRAVSQHGRV